MFNAQPHPGSKRHDGLAAATDGEADLPLFRSEAIQHNEAKWLGEVTFSQPLAFKAMAIFAVAVTIATTLLGYFGTYTKKSTVVGEIMPEDGVTAVYSRISGHVVRSNIAEGKRVKKGDVLLVISGERMTREPGSIAEQRADYAAIEELLAGELNATRRLQRADSEHARATVKHHIQTIQILDQMIALQKQRLAVSEVIEASYEKSLASQHVSEAEVATKQADVLDQKSRLVSLEESMSAERSDLDSAQRDVDELPLRVGNSIADYKRLYHSAHDNISEIEGRQDVSVIAPVSGTTTAINTFTGSGVDPTKPLLSIVPDASRLEAMLYAPSKDVRFVRIGDIVKIRYDTFPYGQNAMSDGRVVSISKSALTPTEFSSLGELIMQRIGAQERGVPLYRLTVALEDQFLVTNGRREDLRAHMILEADVIEDTRRLYQWALEPPYGFTR